MPIIPAGREDLEELKGIHLWHAGMSNCSQRCRITLAELGLEWESHEVNLQKAEHATEEYQQINPNGVVPALVHDGTVVINSVDIIAYLDENFGDGSLRPPEYEEEIAAALAHADKSQLGLKYCTFEFIFSGGPRPDEETFQKLVNGLHDEWLQDFHHEYRAGFSRERIHEMVGLVHADLTQLEARLGDGRKWMAGADFTLADIAWMPNLRRYYLLRWPLERYPRVNEWFKNAAARDSFRIALEGWEPKPLLDVALPKLDERIANGDGVTAYGPLAA